MYIKTRFIRYILTNVITCIYDYRGPNMSDIQWGKSVNIVNFIRDNLYVQLYSSLHDILYENVLVSRPNRIHNDLCTWSIKHHTKCNQWMCWKPLSNMYTWMFHLHRYISVQAVPTAFTANLFAIHVFLINKAKNKKNTSKDIRQRKTINRVQIFKKFYQPHNQLVIVATQGLFQI